MKRVIIIRPSGNFYGSERVLYDYLTLTEQTYDLFVPRNSLLKRKLNNLVSGENILHEYDTSSHWKFYLRMAFRLLGGRFKSVYLNEAGHVKYILLLAKLFPWIK